MIENREEAFNAMVMRQQDLIWHVCSDYSLSAAYEIEDGVQEVLCALWRSSTSLKGAAVNAHGCIKWQPTRCLCYTAKQATGLPAPSVLPPSRSASWASRSAPMLVVAPNPATGGFNVSVSEPIVQLSLLDIRGCLIRSWTNPGEECVVDARSLTAGIYFVVATTATGISSQRVVVE